MAIGFYRKVRVTEGCGDRFEALLQSYAAAVIENAEGRVLMAYVRSSTDPMLFTIHEEYADEQTLDMHRNSDLERLWLPVLMRHVLGVTVSRFAVADEDKLVSLS